ncbi:MAG: hypothetical protein IPG74_09925 [Flavobacteriales bacterium]|nr:hypothetical protein [Flavobacteriales bacterium]
MALVRYHSDGSLDTTFNEDGKATYGGAGDNENLRAVVLQPDGRIIAGGYSRPDGWVWRLFYWAMTRTGHWIVLLGRWGCCHANRLFVLRQGSRDPAGWEDLGCRFR